MQDLQKQKDNVTVLIDKENSLGLVRDRILAVWKNQAAWNLLVQLFLTVTLKSVDHTYTGISILI